MVGASLWISTTKTGRHDIAEILLKVALNTKNQSINQPKLISKNRISGKKVYFSTKNM
jgi:hypothetical protein